MRRLVVLLGVLGALWAAEAQAEAPRVATSTPAGGARGVPVSVGHVTIGFDRAMNTKASTLAEVPGVPFPELAKAGPRWVNAKTFAIPLGTLKPNTTYAMQLNGERRKGFASAEAVPLPVTVLTFTTGEAGTEGMPASGAGYKILNLATDFVAYYDACQGASPQERTAMWDKLLESRYPDFFAQVLYRNKAGADRERFKKSFITWFWKEGVAKIENVRQMAPTVSGRIVGVMAQFRKQFPDFKPATDFYVTVAYSFKGKVLGLNGKDIFAQGLEDFTPGSPQLSITIAHELFHLYHFQFFSTRGALYRSLWAEGMASYASDRLVPGHRMSTVLGFSGQKMNTCHDLLPTMAKQLLEKMGEQDKRLERIYFGAEKNDTPIPPEAGYYVGYLVVASLAKPHSLGELAKMDAKVVYALVRRELTRLAGRK